MTRIPNFLVQQHRSINLASLDSVPQIMIVTGPNGCGKSTLLDCLRSSGGSGGPILYVGPHRVSARQVVRMRFLAGRKLLMRDLQATDNLPNYEGINIHSRTRSAWDFDESASYLKYALCQIELDRQSALTTRFDKDGRVDKDAMPDIWAPLKEMTENLLPHLRFDRIDVSNRDSIRCLWKIFAKDVEVDIDDLSSGEKAIIQLFFPLIETRVQSRLREFMGETEPDSEEASIQNTLPISHESICVLMDEPELHLHPNLQGKILSYLRNLSGRDGVQFILATHSTTIVEQASSDELFLLRPAELVSVGENQLVRIASSEEKLQMMREVFGSTTNITAMKKVVVVEGSKAHDGSRRAADERVFGFLSDTFSQFTVISGGGKSECKTLAESISEILSEEISQKLRAVALVDRDVEENATDELGVIYLPVSTIENFLVDPQVIWAAVRLVRHKVSLKSEGEVEAAIDSILDGRFGAEVERRVKALVGVYVFRLHDPVDEAQRQVDEFVERVRDALSEEKLGEFTTKSRRKVVELQELRKRREQFDGKKVLEEFYRRYMQGSGMSKEIFVYGCAKEAANRVAVKKFVQDLAEKMEAELVGEGGLLGK